MSPSSLEYCFTNRVNRKISEENNNNNKYFIEATLKYRLQIIKQFFCVLFPVGYTLFFIFLFIHRINQYWDELKGKEKYIFSS